MGPMAPRPLPSTPARAADRAEGCPVGNLFAMLGQPHMLSVLHVFLQKPERRVRFGELQTELALSPKTLSRRLKTLVESGLLVRRQYNEIPPRVDYEATDKAQQFGELFHAMELWARHNTLETVRTVSIVGRT